jgi:DNA-binding CsgD family transcriptional regulator
MMIDYEKIKDQDWLHQTLSSNPGTTLNIEGIQGEPTQVFREHRTKYRMAHAQASLCAEPSLGLWTAISFYRGPERPPFTEAERQLKQALTPHLVEAWHLNAFHFLDRKGEVPQDQQRRGRALIDAEGYAYNAEPAFAELLALEFPDWSGPDVPAEIRNAPPGTTLDYGVASIHCGQLEPDGLRLVTVRQRSETAKLTPREREVAEAYAAGLTYREIAAELGSSPTTVRNQLQSVYAKLGVSTKVELVQRVGSDLGD